MLYTKHIVNTVKMTNWGRSYYNNVLALGPVAIMVLISGEPQKFLDLYYSGTPLPYFPGSFEFLSKVFVPLSCLMGLGISIAGFVCRESVSATSFSVVGNMNKVRRALIPGPHYLHQLCGLGLPCLRHWPLLPGYLLGWWHVLRSRSYIGPNSSLKQQAIFFGLVTLCLCL